jgi:urea carboxylase
VIEVLAPGPLTTIQDWPGRVGLWELGVPPSGPMDPRSFQIANLLVGNPPGVAGLEATLAGPRLRFDAPTVVAVCGAPVPVTLDGRPVPTWTAVDVPAGGVLAVGAFADAGMRCAVAVSGGLAAEPVMGSVAAFVAAKLGPAPLAAGDRLEVSGPRSTDGSTALRSTDRPARAEVADGSALAPVLTDTSTLRVVTGPHGAPDILTTPGLRELFREPWTVHHQSDRTGVRLTGPVPDFARADGGAAGLHPSNILDSAYGVGTIMLSGDVAVVVGVDGPSLGGFAAIGQIIRADRWKLGQLRAGDTVVLDPVTPEAASLAFSESEAELATLMRSGGPASRPPAPRFSLAEALAASRPAARRTVTVGAALLDRPGDGAHGPVTYRQAGDGAVLVEFGAPEIDLRSRVRVHTLQQMLRAEQLDAILDLTPGVRSLHVHFDPTALPLGGLLDRLTQLEGDCPVPEMVTVAARTVHLPLAWRHSQAMLAMERYRSVSPNAPWLPDNIEFIRRINGIEDEAEVQRIVTAARYLVLGLGDVYMGAPVAVPIDPRHRLVTTKYTPARTWTPANAVGIGGAFLCVYGIEGPGGYQLVGRTVPIWYPGDARPCLLNHFDQLRFALVPEAELEALRHEALHGSWRPATEPVAFSLVPHAAFVAEHAGEIDRFTASRELAFAQERDAWRAAA